MENKALVTGANGFVGAHLVKCLAQTGVGVTAVFRTNPTGKPLPDFGGKVSWIQADVTVDDLSKRMIGIATVYHLAARFAPGSSKEVLDQLCDVNVRGTASVAKAAIASGVKRFILVSSVAACEASDQCVITEDNGIAITSYGISKLKSEEALKEVATGKMDYIVLRPTALFGEEHLGSIYELARAIKRRTFLLIGDGRNHVNFQYIEDFIDVLTRAESYTGIENDTFIVADTPITLLELVHSIKRELHRPLTTFRIPMSLGLSTGYTFDFLARVFHRSMPLSASRVRAMTRDVCYSSDKLRKQLPDGFPYGVRAGLARTLQWYRFSGLL